jgi:hypothetical protein
MAKRPLKKLEYLPAPDVPKSFYTELAKIIPQCPGYPDERYLRFVWGCDRLEYRSKARVGVEPRRRYPDYDGKYIGRPRWILEGWQNSDVYVREDWNRNSHLLGDYPNRGVWDFIEFHEDAEGNYLPLDETALERARSWAFWKSKGYKRNVEEILTRIELYDAMELEARRQAADKVLDEFADEWVKAEESQNNIVYSLPPGMKQTESGLIIPT